MSTRPPTDKEQPPKTWKQRLKDARNAFSQKKPAKPVTKKPTASAETSRRPLANLSNTPASRPISTRPILINAMKAKQGLNPKRASSIISKPDLNLQNSKKRLSSKMMSDLPVGALSESDLMQRKRKKEFDQASILQATPSKFFLENINETYHLKSDREMELELKKESEQSLGLIYQDLLRIGSHPYYEILATRDEDEFNFNLRNSIHNKAKKIENVLGKEKCEKIMIKMLNDYDVNSSKVQDIEDLKAFYKLTLGMKNIRYSGGALSDKSEVSKKINLLTEKLEKRLGEENFEEIKKRWDLQAKEAYRKTDKKKPN